MIVKNMPNGMVLQSLSLAKEHFPTLEAAQTWVKDSGADTSDFEDFPTNWSFHQTSVTGDVVEMDTETPGISAFICKQVEKAMADENDVSGGERQQLASGHDTLPNIPAGAAFLTKMAALADEGVGEIERHKHLMEHPEIKKAMEGAHQELLDGSEHLKGCMKAWYPEHKLGTPKKEESTEDQETDDEQTKYYKSCRRYFRKQLDVMGAMEEDKQFKPGSGVEHVKMPLGARCVVKALDRIHAAHKAVQDEMGVQEHPEVKSLATHLNSALPERKNMLCGMMKSHYPEVHKQLGWETGEEAPKDEDTDEDETSEEDETEETGDEAEPEKESEEKPEKKVEDKDKKEEKKDEKPKEEDKDKEKEKAMETTVEKMVLSSKAELKSGDHFIEVCSCGVVMGQCKCMAVGKKTILTSNGCEECQKKLAAGQQVVKGIIPPWKKTVVKEGAQQMEPPLDPSEEAVPAGDPVKIVQAMIEYLQDVLSSLGAAETVEASDQEDNPYQEPTRPGPAKANDDEEVVEKAEEEAVDDEEYVQKDDEEMAMEGGLTKKQMEEFAAALSDIQKDISESSRRFDMLAGTSNGLN